MVMNFMTSKQGKIVIGVLVVLAVIGGYKWKISSLQSKLDRAKAENATMQIRNKLCQSDLGMLKNSVDRQNGLIDRLKTDKDTLEEDAKKRAVDAIRPPEEVEVIVNADSGPVSMNKFLTDIFEGE